MPTSSPPFQEKEKIAKYIFLATPGWIRNILFLAFIPIITLWLAGYLLRIDVGYLINELFKKQITTTKEAVEKSVNDGVGTKIEGLRKQLEDFTSTIKVRVDGLEGMVSRHEKDISVLKKVKCKVDGVKSAECIDW